MIWVANKNNVLDGALHYQGDEIEAPEQPNENWDLKPGQKDADEDDSALTTAQRAIEQSIGAFTVPQLRQYAAERGIELPAQAKKSEILDIIGNQQ